MKKSIMLCVGLGLCGLILTGCATKLTYVHHPSVYENRGRPDWTYDENRIKEDLHDENAEVLCEELRNPDLYYFFLGTQTGLCQTEERARQGAILDAGNHFKQFLKTSGTDFIEDSLQKKLNDLDLNDFETKIHMIAITEIKHLKPVRWCVEEKRTSQWQWRYLFTTFRWYTPQWRAWCAAAFPRKRCADIYQMLLEQAEVENLENFTPTRAQSLDEHLKSMGKSSK